MWTLISGNVLLGLLVFLRGIKEFIVRTGFEALLGAQKNSERKLYEAQNTRSNVIRKPLMALAGVLLSSVAHATQRLELSERLPGNEESVIALAIALGALLTAWLLNHKLPAARVTGTVLAALACLSTAAWFLIYVLGTGFLDNPKPAETPLDLAKPALLWLQSIVALIVGLGLLFVAYQQSSSSSSEELDLGNENQAHRYGRVSRVLHWTIAILFIAMIPMGIFATVIPEGVSYRLEYYVVHKTIGVTIFALVVMRLVWNRRSRRPELDAGLKPVERKLAHGVHIALYFLMIALPVTGFIMTSYFGAPTYYFVWEMQPLWEASESGVVVWGVLHKYLLPYLIYAILGAHVIGALKHQFIDKHGSALGRMVGTDRLSRPDNEIEKMTIGELK